MSYSRQRAILIYILKSNKGLSGYKLSKKFKVSTRTIRSDIQFLNKLLQKYDIQIRSSPQKGYFIRKDQKVAAYEVMRNVFSQKKDLYIVPNTPSERFCFIIYKLAFETDFISMEELAKMLYVSKTTIYLDIQKIIRFLNEFPDLSVKISPIKGLILNGKESSKRSLILNVLKRDKSQDNLILSKSFHYALCDKNLNIDKEIIFLYEIVVNTLNKFGYILAENNVDLLVKDLLISVKRIQLGFAVEEKFKEEMDLSIVNSLREEVEDYFNIKLSTEELKYFQQSFNSKRLLNVIDSKNYILKNDIKKITDEFIEKVKRNFNIDFSSNCDFKNNLMLHLNPMIERLRANYFEYNPLKDQIKKNYPFAFEISMSIVPIIKERLGIVVNDSEISYIALHVAVALKKIHKKVNVAIVCGSGLGTALLIKNKIISYYRDQINVIGHFPLYKLNDIIDGKFGKVDLIITTVSIDTIKNIPVIQVSPLIDDKDLLKIKDYVESPLITIKGSEYKESSIVNTFFKKSLFKCFEKEEDYFKVILQLTKLLKKEGYIQDTAYFYNSVIKREKLYSTILDNMVAIPHPMESLSKTTVVSVGILKKPITYNNKKVKIVILFAANAKEDEKLKILYEILGNMLDSQKLINNISKYHNFNDFIKILIEGVV